jgi:hypothetical protein
MATTTDRQNDHEQSGRLSNSSVEAESIASHEQDQPAVIKCSVTGYVSDNWQALWSQEWHALDNWAGLSYVAPEASFNDTDARTTTFLWDVMKDQRDNIDREEHDRLSLLLAYDVATKLCGFDEDKDAFVEYLNDAPNDVQFPITLVNKMQSANGSNTLHHACALVYYYAWLIPMLDEHMRDGFKEMFECDERYTDRALNLSVQALTVFIRDYWFDMSIDQINTKCNARLKAIIEDDVAHESSVIDWYSMDDHEKDESGKSEIDRFRNKVSDMLDSIHTHHLAELDASVSSSHGNNIATNTSNNNNRQHDSSSDDHADSTSTIDSNDDIIGQAPSPKRAKTT